jgi:integrase
MASFRKRAGKWQVRITVKGFPETTKSFSTKAEAQQWAREIESTMYKGEFQHQAEQNHILFGDVLKQYLVEVTPSKRSRQRETEWIGFVQRFKLVSYSMDKLTPAAIAEYRDERLKTISAGTFLREISILSSVINHARKEWGVTIQNPCDRIRKPAIPIGRSRLLSKEEEALLIHELQPIKRRSAVMVPLVLFALETAMRRGEILSLLWENISLTNQTATLPLTKNGTKRIVPLSLKAVHILKQLNPKPEGVVFPISYMSLSNCFTDACKRAEIKDLHFHDLRHTATTKLAEKLPNVIELASVTGHQTIQMLKRYYHPNAQLLAKKLG